MPVRTPSTTTRTTKSAASPRPKKKVPARAAAPPRKRATPRVDAATAERDAMAKLMELAIALALDAHRGQTDKYHQPYILHVLGVAGRCRTLEEKIVAFLHDVVEDTPTTCDDLIEMGFNERIVAAVECLTRRKGETYTAFTARIAPNALARAVKLADLEDNMDIRRSNRPMKVKDAARMEKYRKAWQMLAELHVRGE